MQATRPMTGAGRSLIAAAILTCFAALCLEGEPTIAAEATIASEGRVVAAKADRLVVMPARRDHPTPDRTESASPAAAKKPALAPRGAPARKLVDVAVRDDGLWLNSFETRSMPLEALACAALSDQIVSRLPTGAVERLAEEELMRQTRVCALNGSLLVTCYGGAATVSVRPAQHGDGCGD